MQEEKVQRLSEGYDFIEENTAFCDEPLSYQDINETVIVESTGGKTSPYKILGKILGIFAPINEFSRNRRLYSQNLWPTVLANEEFQNRLKGRRIFSCLGHEDKKIDDFDLKEGKVSGIVSCLEVRDDANGKPFLYGEIDILDTPAGRILKAMHEGGAGLYVSSRGAGKLIPVPGQEYSMVTPENYYCHCFDTVLNPGFIQAKPVFEQVKESTNESVNEEAIEEDATDKSIRRNADKNIKKLDKEIKQASKEFDQAYLKKQVDPNINLHPYAEKEGNLRIAKDKEVERRNSVTSESEIETLKAQINKLAAVVEKVVDDVYEVDEKHIVVDPTEEIHSKAEQVKANINAPANKKALKEFIERNKQIAESEQFVDFIKLLSETDVSEDVLGDIFGMIFNGENK